MKQHRITRRRALLAAGAGAGLLASTPAYAQEAAPLSAAQAFAAQNQFVIAHRGAGDVNPEHTAYAYQQAILKGAQAVEISVRSTKDGHLVCMHDNPLRRTTTEKQGYVSTSTLAEVKRAMIDTRDFLGEGTPLQNIATLDEALDVIAATPKGGSYQSAGADVIYFVEAKDSRSQLKVLETMQRRGLTGQTVIKMYRNGKAGYAPSEGFVQRAKNAGFMTWCYFDSADPLESIAAMAASPAVDMLGVPYFETVTGRSRASMSDEKISAVVALGKPVIVWEVHRRSVQQHLAALGVRGFMSSDPYWLSGGGTAADLKLTTARRQHGMLPAGAQVAANMPQWDRGALVHQQVYDESIMLGTLSHLAATSSSYVVRFALTWRDQLPTSTWQYGYLAFGRETDAAFGLGEKHLVTGTNGCYVLAVRPAADALTEDGVYVQGDMVQLLRIDHGSSQPVPVATITPKTPFAANQPIDCKLIVRPDSLVIEVAGTRSAPIADASFRGPYMHFGRFHGNDRGGALALSNLSAYRIA